jgi:DNA-directed RNA polymerase subunit RPC12/RpoP
MFCFKCQKEVDPVEAGDETEVLLKCGGCGSIILYDTFRILNVMPLFSLSGEYFDFKRHNLFLKEKGEIL